MARFLRLAGFAVFAGLGVFYLWFGATYASVHKMLWFHAAAVPAEIRPALAPLYFALMKLIGGLSITLAFAGFWILLGKSFRESRLPAIALAAMFAGPLVMAAYVAETLAANTGAPTSWRLMGILLGADVLALAATLLAQTSSAAHKKIAQIPRVFTH